MFSSFENIPSVSRLMQIRPMRQFSDPYDTGKKLISNAYTMQYKKQLRITPSLRAS